MPEAILCFFEYFGYQNIRKAKDERLNVGKAAASIKERHDIKVFNTEMDDIH